MVGVVGIIIKINSFFFQKPPGYETVSATRKQRLRADKKVGEASDINKGFAFRDIYWLYPATRAISDIQVYIEKKSIPMIALWCPPFSNQ